MAAKLLGDQHCPHRALMPDISAVARLGTGDAISNITKKYSKRRKPTRKYPLNHPTSSCMSTQHHELAIYTTRRPINTSLRQLIPTTGRNLTPTAILTPTRSSHSRPIFDTTFSFITKSLISLFALSLTLAVVSSEFSPNNNNNINNNNNNNPYQRNKNSAHFHISEICPTKSAFPIVKQVEGAVLSSTADINVNCTITFRAKSAYQHFIVRFEDLKLGCDDHLIIYDSDLNFGPTRIKDFSCRDSLASVNVINTTNSYLTMLYSTDNRAKSDDGFRLVVTAVFEVPSWDCPLDHTTCRNDFCISKSLLCDGVNHCVDNSDEIGCSSIAGSSGGSFFAGDLSLANALGLLVVLVLIIFTCVILFISAVYCRRESHYAQYQHHLQRAIGVPLQTSSSLMFTNHQPMYQYFPANVSPYITPQHAYANTIARGYSTLPLNLAAAQPVQRQPQMQQQQQMTAFNPQNAQAINRVNSAANPTEYLMMSGLAGPPTAAMQATPRVQTNLFLPTSQSILR